MTIKKHDIVEVTAELRGETDKAFRLFNGSEHVWVPKQFVENNKDGTFSMPQWLAKDKGLI